jgi:hypothetical protein
MFSVNSCKRYRVSIHDTIILFLWSATAISVFLGQSAATAKEPKTVVANPNAGNWLVLAKFVPPPKKQLSSHPDDWMYEIKKDAMGNAIFEYQLACWLLPPQIEGDVPAATKIKRKIGPREGVHLDIALMPSPAEEFAMAEITEGADKILWIQKIWPIGEIKQIDTDAVCKNEKAGYQNVIALRKYATTAEKLKALPTITSQRDFKASLILVVEVLKIPEVTLDEYSSLYEFLDKIISNPESPQYVKKFVNVRLRGMSKPEK